MFHFLWALIVGFFVGLIARALLPGVQHLGFLMTTCLGIAGSLVGGLLGALISKPAPGAKFHPAGFLLSIVCSIGLLLLWGFIRH